jgi:hypothetical protein
VSHLTEWLNIPPAITNNFQPTNVNLTGWAAIPTSITNSVQPSNANLTGWSVIATNQMMNANIASGSTASNLIATVTAAVNTAAGWVTQSVTNGLVSWLGLTNSAANGKTPYYGAGAWGWQVMTNLLAGQGLQIITGAVSVDNTLSNLDTQVATSINAGLATNVISTNLIVKTRSVSANTAVTLNDSVLFVTSGNPFITNLAAPPIGFTLTVINKGTGSVVITNTSASQYFTIAGVGSNNFVKLGAMTTTSNMWTGIFDGSNW